MRMWVFVRGRVSSLGEVHRVGWVWEVLGRRQASKWVEKSWRWTQTLQHPPRLPKGRGALNIWREATRKKLWCPVVVQSPLAGSRALFTKKERGSSAGVLL